MKLSFFISNKVSSYRVPHTHLHTRTKNICLCCVFDHQMSPTLSECWFFFFLFILIINTYKLNSWIILRLYYIELYYFCLSIFILMQQCFLKMIHLKKLKRCACAEPSPRHRRRSGVVAVFSLCETRLMEHHLRTWEHLLRVSVWDLSCVKARRPLGVCSSRDNGL